MGASWARTLIELPVRVLGGLLAGRWLVNWLQEDGGPVVEIGSALAAPIESRLILGAVLGSAAAGFVLAPLLTTRPIFWLINLAGTLTGYRITGAALGALAGSLFGSILSMAVPAGNESGDSPLVLLPVGIVLIGLAIGAVIGSAYPAEVEQLIGRILRAVASRRYNREAGAILDYSALRDGRVLDLLEAGLIGREIRTPAGLERRIRLDLTLGGEQANQAAAALRCLSRITDLEQVRFVALPGDDALVLAQSASLRGERWKLVTADGQIAANARAAGISVIDIGALAITLARRRTPMEIPTGERAHLTGARTVGSESIGSAAGVLPAARMSSIDLFKVEP